MVLALFLQRVTLSPAPDTGKFFYVDYRNLNGGSKYSEHEVDLYTQRKNFQGSYLQYELFVEPSLPSISLMTTDCKSCKILNLYEPSQHAKYQKGSDERTEVLNDYRYSGTSSKDEFKFKLDRYFRETTV